MMKHTILKFASVATVMGALSACSPSLDWSEPYDYRIAHPINVASENVSVAIEIPDEGYPLSPQDQQRLQGFIRDFAIRGRTAVTVETQMADRALAVLIDQGLRGNEIIVVPQTTIMPPAAVLTFSANVAQVPDCGDWTKSSAFNPSNTPDKNFGCSNRRNIGMTVADPGDLIKAKPMSGRGAARQDAAVDSYNAGESIGPETTVTDTQTVSGAFNQ